MSNSIRIEIGDATLYLGDCLEILPTLDKVDCVVTDPPYVGLKGGYDKNGWSGYVAPTRNSKKTIGDEWNASLDWVSLINAKGVIVFCTHHSVTETELSLPEYRKVALLTWYKRNAPPTGKNVPAFKSEFIWCLANGVGIEWDRIKTTVFDIPNLSTGCISTGERITNPDGTVAHPAQKPIELMNELVRIPDGTILDPFMGSGTTGVACANLGRKFIGIEIDERYFRIACERIEAAQAQGRLFE